MRTCRAKLCSWGWAVFIKPEEISLQVKEHHSSSLKCNGGCLQEGVFQPGRGAKLCRNIWNITEDACMAKTAKEWKETVKSLS